MWTVCNQPEQRLIHSSGSAAGNYNSVAGGLTGSPTLSSTQAALTASISNQSKVYGTSDPALSGIAVNLNGVINNSIINTWNVRIALMTQAVLALALRTLTRVAGESVVGSPYAYTAATFNALTGSAAANYQAVTSFEVVLV